MTSATLVLFLRKMSRIESQALAPTSGWCSTPELPGWENCSCSHGGRMLSCVDEGYREIPTAYVLDKQLEV